MKLLLAGETFVATTLDAVGGDALTSATSTNGATAFNAALAAEGITVPQRLHPAVVHPIFAGVEGPLPPILGMNKLDFRNDCSSRLLATCYYRGHGLAAASGSQPRSRPHARLGDRHRAALAVAGFSRWPLYGKMMANMVRWLAGIE
ncbi:glutamine amidotransferase [Mesorhizobium sp. LNHC229A00]|uniref:glutamine amidotransferase n=1 Tax=Mesorhizobium sp. LNHC229A00 TaxID=1287240 RepID=UPI0003CEDD1A|nr:glutamine amidotransferase [Mesorhizobium sp. LNHC229A00]ESY96691.1 hypothetical protein X741_04345 [Mesorhizobium sp. LNHC229A00]